MALDNLPILTRQRRLLAKAETTTGTAATLTSAEGAFIVYTDDNPWTENIEMEERPYMDDTKKYAAVPGGEWAQVVFEAEMIGAATTPAWASVFLQACGWTLSSRTFTLDPLALTTIPSLTLALLEGTRWRTMSGAQGNVVFRASAGKFGRARFTFMGRLEADADAAVVTPTRPSTIPPRWANASAIAVASFAPKVSQFEFDSGCDVQMRESAIATCGYASALIEDANPKLTIDPEMSLVAGRAWQSIQLASTEETGSIVIGGTSNNIITLAWTKGQVMKRSGGSRKKKLLDSIEININDKPTLLFS